MSAKKSEAKGTVRGGHQAINWGSLTKLFEMLQQFGPVMFAFVQAVADIFKKTEMKGADLTDAQAVGDCCPHAKEVAQEIATCGSDLQGIIVRLVADPCDETICKEYMNKVACLCAKGLKLHACHEE